MLRTCFGDIADKPLESHPCIRFKLYGFYFTLTGDHDPHFNI